MDERQACATSRCLAQNKSRGNSGCDLPVIQLIGTGGRLFWFPLGASMLVFVGNKPRGPNLRTTDRARDGT